MADNINLKQGSEPMPRIRMGESGAAGISEVDGYIHEQIKKELRFPYALDTYRNMYNDPLIFAGINLKKNIMQKTQWKVKPVDDPTQEDLQKAEFIRQCMDDMDHSWGDFIKSILNYLIYGFGISEKVFRRRSKSKGSKYNDNLIGWRKMSPRSQRTLRKWKFSDDAREFLGVYQDLSLVNSNGRYNMLNTAAGYTGDGLFIPKEKFLHFKRGGDSVNPEGESALSSCWLPWKFKVLIEENEAIGISRDMVGMPVIRIHPKYMSPDATPEDAAVYEYYKNVVRNIHAGEQSGLIIPQMFDDNGKPIIDFQLMGVSGGKQYDTDSIVKRYEDKILTALFVDILKLGQQSHGSFSLAGAKTNIMAMDIEARLQEIKDVINNDLVKQTFQVNGWDTARLPEVYFEDLDEEDLDELSKMVQRIGSVNMLPRTPDMVSQIVKRAGFRNHEDIERLSQEELEELFTENDSGASEGMQEGMPSGTGKANENGSETNSDNSA